VTLDERLTRSLEELGVADGDRVGVACSGGADSIALVGLLARSKRAGAVVVLHVDHGLRADSADDASFVHHSATQLGLDCDVRRVAVEPGASLEARAREARYAALARAASELGLSFVLTAHTLDDQAETVLHRATRGGGLEGIAAVRGIFVRPVLGVRRAELRAWLEAEGLTWREDPSNEDLRHDRNWLRHVILPLLRERRPGADEVLARLASRSAADDQVLDSLASDAFSHAEIDDAGVFLPADVLDPLPGALATRVCRSALRRVGVDPSWIDLDRIASLRRGRHIECGDAAVWRLSDGLVFMRAASTPEVIALPTAGTTEAGDWGVRVRVGSPRTDAWTWRSVVPQGSGAIVLRSRRPGDRVATPMGTRKVQDVLVDAKVPRPLRDFVPLVACSRGVVAVVGLTSVSGPGSVVVDVEPNAPTWSRNAPWTRAS
jgi:tRNA(Ile)-lysidine synthase